MHFQLIVEFRLWVLKYDLFIDVAVFILRILGDCNIMKFLVLVLSVFTCFCPETFCWSLKFIETKKLNLP